MREATLEWMVKTADTMPWYKDARAPQVALAAPDKQFEQREENCSGCQASATCTLEISTPPASDFVVTQETAGVWSTFATRAREL